MTSVTIHFHLRLQLIVMLMAYDIWIISPATTRLLTTHFSWRLWFRADPVGPVRFVLWLQRQRRQLSLQLCKCRGAAGGSGRIFDIFISVFREQRKLFSSVSVWGFHSDELLAYKSVGPLSPVCRQLGVQNPKEVLSLVVVSFRFGISGSLLKAQLRTRAYRYLYLKDELPGFEMSNRKMRNFMSLPA